MTPVRARTATAAGTIAGALVLLRTQPTLGALLVVTLGYGPPGDLCPYLRGLGVLYTNVHVENPTYFAGAFHAGGVPYYFIAVFLLKTPTPFLALLGAFETHPWLAGVASLGVIFAAYYMLPMVQRMFFNRLERELSASQAEVQELKSSADKPNPLSERVRQLEAENNDLKAKLTQSEKEKAEELALLKQFSDSIIESVNVGILVIDGSGRITTSCRNGARSRWHSTRARCRIG